MAGDKGSRLKERGNGCLEMKGKSMRLSDDYSPTCYWQSLWLEAPTRCGHEVGG